MRTLRFLLQKEFRQILRSKSLLFSIIVGPVIQLTLLPLAANFEVKNIEVAVVDHDHSTYSKKLIDKIYASKYFSGGRYRQSYAAAADLVEKNKADIVLEIPQGFEDNLVRDGKDEVFLAVNAINGTKAGVGSGYLTAIIADFNQDIRLQWNHPGHFSEASTIDLVN